MAQKRKWFGPHAGACWVQLVLGCETWWLNCQDFCRQVDGVLVATFYFLAADPPSWIWAEWPCPTVANPSRLVITPSPRNLEFWGKIHWHQTLLVIISIHGSTLEWCCPNSKPIYAHWALKMWLVHIEIGCNWRVHISKAWFGNRDLKYLINNSLSLCWNDNFWIYWVK